ncbi:MAG: hypothetical protein IPM54_45455 [Polyangiaceae bacterium]|nr:hypothetical protein [Polyangiaceae bacterium]
MSGRHFARIAAPFVLCALPAFAWTGCSSDASQDPSYLRVKLVPAITAATIPLAVRVVIANESTGALIESLCINIEGVQGTTTATFVLRRDVGKPASDRISIEVTPFDVIAGQDTAEPGKEFACPVTLPAATGDAQKVSVDFCEGETRALQFHVGAICCADASCECESGFVCGTGISSPSMSCGPSTCCRESITSCELDI